MHSTITTPRIEVPGRAVPAFATAGVLAIAAVVAVAHLIASFGDVYWLDEVYMLALGRHPLQWSYVDQPPLTPLIAMLMDKIAPGSILVLRIPALLVTAVTVVIAALIARELGADKRAQIITAFAQASVVWVTFVGHWLTPYTLEPLIWGLLFFVLVRWLRTRDDRMLLWLGLIAGIGAQTKFQIFMLCGALVVCALVFGPRSMFTRPKFWIGAGIATVIAAPTLIWQALHGWPQLKMGAIVEAETQVLSGGRAGAAASMLIYAGVAGIVLMLYGLWRMCRDRDYRFLGATVILLYVFIIVTSGRPYYLDGAYAIGIAAGAVGLQRRREAGHTKLRWVIWPSAVLSAVVMIGMLFLAWNSNNPKGTNVGDTIGAHAGQAYHALPSAQQKHTVVMGESYIDGAFLDAYAPRYSLPAVYSPNRGYGYLPQPAADKDTVLFIGKKPTSMQPYFSQIRKVVEGGDESVWLVSGKHADWNHIWPAIRTLTV